MKEVLEAIIEGTKPALIFFKQFRRELIIPDTIAKALDVKPMWKLSENHFSRTIKPDHNTFPVPVGKHYPYSEIAGIFTFNSPFLNEIHLWQEFVDRYPEFEKEMDDITGLVKGY